MNWDCSLILRSSTDENTTTASFKQLKQKINTNKRSTEQKKTLGSNQGEKSREMKKKMSLKSKNSSISKKCDGLSTLKDSELRYDQQDTQESRRRREGRIHTEPNVSNFANTCAEEVAFSNMYSTHCYVQEPQRSPNFRTAVVTASHYQTNSFCQFKVTPFSTTATSARVVYANNPGKVCHPIAGQLPKKKPVVKFCSNQIAEQVPRVQSVVSFKNLGPRSEKKPVKLEKENVSNANNEVRQFEEGESYQINISSTIAEESREIKKKVAKIEDFLTSKGETKSVRDSDELSSEYSRVVFTYAELLREQNKPRPSEIQ